MSCRGVLVHGYQVHNLSKCTQTCKTMADVLCYHNDYASTVKQFTVTVRLSRKVDFYIRSGLAVINLI